MMMMMMMMMMNCVLKNQPLQSKIMNNRENLLFST